VNMKNQTIPYDSTEKQSDRYTYPDHSLPQLPETLDSVATGVILLDEGRKFLYINHAAEQMIDVKAEDVIGQAVDLFIQDAGVIDLITLAKLDKSTPYVWHDRLLFVSISRFGRSRRPSGHCLLLQSMLPFENMDEVVHQVMDEFSSLMESSYDGIIVADQDSILNVNASFGRITGVAPSLLMGKRFSELDTEKHVCLAAVTELIHSTQHRRRTLTLIRKLTSGNEIFLTGNPVFDRHGHVVRVLLNIRDVTDLKSLEDQIKNIRSLCEDPAGVSGDRSEAVQGIVAESPVMRRLLDLVFRVSRVDSTVIVQGESGVGKDVFARLLHRLGGRSQRPFVSVNCGAIPDTLLESEFFGYEKGAFTGAGLAGKKGLFEQANKGILFLDEVGELPHNLQVKLLKVIQDKRCRPLGSQKTIDLDVRIIAATNRNLKQMAAEGSFRMDLFYRLYVVPIEIPPLRERREDILPLSLMFLRKFNHKYKVSRTLGHEVLYVLENYDWPGNVREIQNVIERMVVTADATALGLRHLPDSVYQSRVARSVRSGMPPTMNLKKAKEMVERNLIEKALMETGGPREASKVLGVDRTTVIRKAQRYGLNIKEVVSRANQDYSSPTGSGD
jgi:PAS domain S-box-containing protein